MNDENEAEGTAPEATTDAYQPRDMSSILGGRASESRPEPPDTGDTAEASTPDASHGEPEPQPAAKGAPPAPDDGPVNWREARTALKSVTEENKALKRQIEEITRRVMAPEQTPKVPDVPDPLIDPEGFRQHMADERFRERVELTAEMMVDAVGEEKFEAAKAAFIEAAQHDPELRQQLRHAANPAKLAYQVGSKILESRGAPEKDRAALEEEITAKVMAKLGLKPDGTPLNGASRSPARQSVTPTSLADVRSVSGPSGAPAWEGPKPLSALIGPRRK